MSHILRRLIHTPIKERLAGLRAEWRTGQIQRTTLYTLESLFILHVILQYGFEIRTPYGVSMQPTMATDGEIVLIDKTARRGRNVQVGDVVAFDHPIMESHAVKRIVGMPGDFVLAGTPEAKGGPLEDMMIQVPKGHCFVAGDNQQWSRDSRVFGPLPLPLIRGRVRTILWPPSSFGAPGNGLRQYKPDPISDID